MKHNRIPRAALAVSMTASLLIVSDNAENLQILSPTPAPYGVLSVDCKNTPGDADTINLLPFISGATPHEQIVVDVNDQYERRRFHVRVLGHSAINGKEFNDSDAGKILARFQDAELVAGVPAPNILAQTPGEYYAGDVAMTFRCLGATFEDVRRNGMSG